MYVNASRVFQGFGVVVASTDADLTPEQEWAQLVKDRDCVDTFAILERVVCQNIHHKAQSLFRSKLP